MCSTGGVWVQGSCRGILAEHHDVYIACAVKHLLLALSTLAPHLFSVKIHERIWSRHLTVKDKHCVSKDIDFIHPFAVEKAPDLKIRVSWWSGSALGFVGGGKHIAEGVIYSWGCFVRREASVNYLNRKISPPNGELVLGGTNSCNNSWHKEWEVEGSMLWVGLCLSKR